MRINDDPLWLVAGVYAYLAETGDVSILTEPVPFNNVEGSEQPLLEHLRRSVNFTITHKGPHGIPLIGRADWNDCLNLNCFSDTPGESFQTVENNDTGVAESVFIGGMFVLYGSQYADILEHYGRLAGMSDAEIASEAANVRAEFPRPSKPPAGTANGSCAPTTPTRARSARMRTPKARSTSNRRACA